MRKAPTRELFTRFPGLQNTLPCVELGQAPTAVRFMAQMSDHLGSGRLYVKRDDQLGSPGGGKLRKLELVLGDAKQRGSTSIITCGAMGSNHVAATATCARQLGLRTTAVLVPQPVHPYVLANLRHTLEQDAQVIAAAWPPGVATRMLWRYVRDRLGAGERPYLVPPGASSRLGVLGYVDAALELAAQVEAGLVPEPDFVFVAAGTCGSLAGLVLGVRLAGLRCTPVGVRVYGRLTANERTVALLANRAHALLRRADPRVPDLRIRRRDVVLLHDQFGPGYGVDTPEGDQAVALASRLEGLELEGTYTGKALAGMLRFMAQRGDTGTVAVFFNTYGPSPAGEQALAVETLPRALRRVIRGAEER